MAVANKCKQVTAFEYNKIICFNHQTVAKGLKLNRKILWFRQNKIQ